MKRSTPASATHVIAESIRRQLGTDAVVLITPGSPEIAVVAAQTPDASDRPRDSADPDREPAANTQHGERLAYSEAARALGLSWELIYDQLRTGRLESLKVGQRRIITREHIDKFLGGPPAVRMIPWRRANRRPGASALPPSAVLSKG